MLVPSISWPIWVLRRVVYPTILSFVGIFNANAAVGQYDQYKIDLYRAFVDSTLLDNTYKLQFDKIFSSMIADHLFDSIRINQPYDYGSLNIYVINTSGRDLMRLRTTNEWIKSVVQRSRNNAFAFDRNVLVFDSAFLADLILNAFNENVSMIQALMEREKNLAAGMAEDEVVDAMYRWNVIRDRHRFWDIRNSITKIDAGHSAISLLPIIMKTLDKDGVLDSLKFALAPVVLHELGHLSSQTAGPFWMYAVQPLDDSQAILAEEEAADEYANTHLRALLKEAAEMKGGELNLQAAVGTVKFMRDKVLFEAFSGFRGLEPEDLFVNLIHWDCRERPDTKSLAFDDVRKVRKGYFGYMPLLTSDEFASIRDRLLKRVRSGTHPHHFVRAQRMLTIIQEISGWENSDILGDPLGLFASALKNDPTVISGKSSQVQREGKSGLSFEALTDRLGMRFQPAVNCPAEECWIGTFDNGQAGFLEVVGPSRDIWYARFMVPVFGNEPFAELSRRKDVREYIMMIAVFMRFFSNIAEMELKESEGDWRQHPLGKLLIDIRSQAFECGTATRMIRLKSRTVVVSTVNERGWMSFDVFGR